MARNALGKGLGALIGGNAAAVTPVALEPGESIRQVGLDTIVPSPFQPRRTFTAEHLDELAASIQQHGIIQPLVVRRVGNKHELIAGERRWRAARLAGLKEVPVVVRQKTDQEAAEEALIENLIRADLNPMEEADGYARLIESHHLTQEQVAERVGKSRTAVTNALRLRNLSTSVRTLVGEGKLSSGHAKVLLGLPTAALQDSAAKSVVQGDLSVRATEALVRALLKSGGKSSGKKTKPAAADWRDIELRLQRSLGTKVRLVGSGKKGHLEIQYFNEADLDRLLLQFGVRPE
ncbi:MAG: ParB/RepB/Spo0J family partition protein [Candidatus Methylacidiphilales bacterium]|nr:ParB/RepB/Spo0J family partition protein [Candidatus Methylacidiphilales bacterium]